MQSKALAGVDDGGLWSSSLLASNLLPREARAIDEALSEAGPESSLLSLKKRAWVIRLGTIKIQEVPGLRFIVRTWRFQEEISIRGSRAYPQDIADPAHIAARDVKQAIVELRRTHPQPHQHMQQQQQQQQTETHSQALVPHMSPVDTEQLRQIDPRCQAMTIKARKKRVPHFQKQGPHFQEQVLGRLDEDVDSESEKIVQGLLRDGSNQLSFQLATPSSKNDLPRETKVIASI